MKRNFIRTFMILSIFVLGFAICASAEFTIIEDFQSYPLTDSFGSLNWRVTGTLSIDQLNANKYLASSSGNIQTNKSIDMTNGSAVISAAFNADDGTVSAALIGRTSESDDKITLFSASASQLTVLKKEKFSINGWTDISFVFSVDNSLNVYLDGTLIYTMDNYITEYPAFKSYEGNAALRVTLTGGMVDDISFYNNISINENYALSSPIYRINTQESESFKKDTQPISGVKKGDIDGFIAYTKLTDNPGEIISARYSDDMLSGIYTANFPGYKSIGIAKIAMPSSALEKDDIIKIFNVTDKEGLVPLTKSVSESMPSYIRMYPSELEQNFSKSGEHPRIMADDTVFASIKAKYLSNHLWCIELVSKADDILTKNELPSVDSGATNILGTSRSCLSQLMTLSLAYYMTDSESYLAYAEAIMNEVCKEEFSNWCRDSHFFSCAEMTAALAIGYDWLYDYLSEDTKTLVKEKIYENSLKFAYDKYSNRILGSDFFTGAGNKNLVYNSAMVITALSLADVYPAECFTIISESFEYIPEALASFAPHGGWSEGTDYWRYAVNYLSMMMASLETVYDTDFGISTFEGFDNAMNFIVQMKGPCGYNTFHDNDGSSDTPAVFYLARRFKAPNIAASRLNLLENLDKLEPLDLIYFDESVNGGDVSNLPLYSCFEGVEAMSMRSSWDNDALFVSAHGGKNTGSHTHVDAGTFVLDYLGERWIMDFGRTGVYDNNAYGHNVFVVNPNPDGEDYGQDLDADVKIYEKSFDTDKPYITYDMTSAYKSYVNAKVTTRQFKLSDENVLKVIDNVKLKSTQNIEWYFYTDADVEIIDNGFKLTKGDKTISLTAKSNAGEELTFYFDVLETPEGVTRKRMKVSANDSSIMVTYTFQDA